MKVLRRATLLLVLMLGILCLSACGKTEISFNEYVELKCTGYDGEGTAEITIDYSKLMSDHEKELNSDDTAKTARLFRKIEFIADKTTGLKNGDTISVDFDSVDVESFGEVGIVPVYSKVELTVEGLQVLNPVDIFEGIEIGMDGFDGYATASLKNWPTSSYRYMFDYNVDSSKYYKNGDTVVVTVELNYEDAIERMAKEGVKPASLTYEYKVAGLEEVTELNPFEYTDTSYYGSAGSGSIALYFKEDAPALLRDNIHFSYDGNSGLKNGDKVKVTASSWYDDENDLAHYRGVKLSQVEAEIEVLGLEDCIRTVESLNEETFNALVEANKNTLLENAGNNWAEPESIRSIAYAGDVIVLGENWSGDASDLYMIYQIDVDSAYEADRYVYWYAKYENVRIYNDGTTNISADSYVYTPDYNFSRYNGEISGEAFVGETNQVYYVGFNTIEELVTAITGESEVAENTAAVVEMTREPISVFTAKLDYLFNGERYDQAGFETAVELTGDGTYTVEYTSAVSSIWNRTNDEPDRLGVVIRDLGEVYNLDNVEFSDIAVTINGEEQKIKQKKVVKKNFVDYPGNADDAAFYVVFESDADEDGEPDLQLVDLHNTWYDNFTITFTITGLTDDNKIASGDNTVVETPDVTEGGEENGDGTETGDETEATGNDNEGAEGDENAVADGSGDENVDAEGDSTDDTATGNTIGYTVTLNSFGESKIQAIKVIRDLTDLGLAEAKALADNAPSVILEHVSYDDAVAAVNAFAEVKAIAEMTEE